MALSNSKRNIHEVTCSSNFLKVVVLGLHAHAPGIYNRARPIKIIIINEIYTCMYLPYHLLGEMNHVVNLWCNST